MTSSAALVALTLGMLAGGCASSPSQPVETSGQVKRVIECVLKPDADPAVVLLVANELSKTTGALDVAAGYESSPVTRSVSRGTRAVTFIMTFRDDLKLRVADRDPAYRRAIDQTLAGSCSAVNVKDVTLQNYQVAEQYTEETTAATLQRRAAAVQEQNELRRRTK